MGAYDGVIVAEAPNDETIARLATSVAAQVNAETAAMRAFSLDDFRRIVQVNPEIGPRHPGASEAYGRLDRQLFQECPGRVAAP